MGTTDQAMAAPPPAFEIATPKTELEVIRRYVARPNLRIIEAGCGRHWPKQLANPSAVLIGVDSDAAALKLRNDLTESHLGDVRTIDLPPASADVVYSAYVLEHVPGADKALENFLSWVKPGGLLILRLPDRDSAYGFLTRCTPHWFHVLYKRYVDKFRHAGKTGFGPYPTFYEPAIARRAIRELCEARGFEVLHDLKVCNYLTTGRLIPVKKAVGIALWALSLGRLSWRYDNLCLIARKKAAP